MSLAGNKKRIAEQRAAKEEFDKKPVEEQNKTTRNSYINDKLKLIVDKQIRSARTKINKAK